MKKFFKFLFFILSFYTMLQSHQDVGEEHRKALLATIPKTSLRKLLLFATLYSHTNDGRLALERIAEAFPHKFSGKELTLPPLFKENVTHLAALSEPTLCSQIEVPKLSEKTLKCIEELGSNLPHKTLRGHTTQSLKQVEQLESCEIDLARALLLLEKELSPQKQIDIPSIEAALDLLALSVLTRTSLEADPYVKIHELNYILFDELALRFPPQSEVEEKVQQFSELSTVLFSRRGICLGATTLYICLAQRIGLPLSVFTPPNHIFVGYKNSSSIRTIETTARGINVSIEEYLGTSLRSLPERSFKEIIGMVAFNRASSALQNKEWEKALQLYTLAHRFESDEDLTQMIAITELILGKKKESIRHAQEARKNKTPHRIEQDLVLYDLQNDFLSKQSAEAILKTTDNEPERLSQHIKKLELCHSQDPTSLSLLLHLAHSWLRYGKPKQALFYFEKLACSKEAPSSIHFILAELYESRMNLPKAWKEAKKAFILAQKQGYIPESLKKYILSLHSNSPNCEDLSDLVLYIKDTR